MSSKKRKKEGFEKEASLKKAKGTQKHKWSWPVSPPVRGQSPSRIARGEMFMHYPWNSRNISPSGLEPCQEDR